MISIALGLGSVSIWHSGFWIGAQGRTPNFTAMSMAFLVLSQWLLLRSGLKEKQK